LEIFPSFIAQVSFCVVAESSVGMVVSHGLTEHDTIRRAELVAIQNVYCGSVSKILLICWRGWVEINWCFLVIHSIT
jgi:hypothetical protein